ncbi:MAG: GlcNAc-PI de-N-acetylase family protein [Caldanaerobacter subterraneus]|uniref:PIG-L family deacetylase n=1 Tax=Caldanaerobacter subterraneus TaxID=911092 RepID=A0A101E7C3_9THEO|nr:PIG-L family deacetylase [Caldanaerobacter subterraneus]KUK09615.1 MAG: GlcNAc-PI de-N-acetylase family protein [Caldanaerobacter subterraneus]HBT48807.1 PIG-L family deacetylase [Caldanaerobacter subterraneus]
MITRRTIYFSLFTAFLIGVSYIMNWGMAIANFTEKATVPTFDDPGQRILIIVPHPDDETLGMAGVIQRAVELKRPVKVVVVTSGESYKKAAMVFCGKKNPTPRDFYKLGLARQQESIAAMRILGLPRKDLIFLGFADGSTRFLWSQYWDNNRPRVSGGTRVAYAPYDTVYKPRAPYTGQTLVDELTEIIKDFKPTDIYYPLADDIHPDHWAVSNFVRYTITAMNLNVREHMFLVHHPQWPVPWMAEKNRPMLPPVDMKNSNTEWQAFELTPKEVNMKQAAIKQYRTQTEVMEPFLMGFVRKTELFATKPVISIPVVSSKPDLRDADLPHTLLKVYTGGMLNEEIYRSAALTKLAAFYHDNKLYVGLESAKPISKKVIYHIEMRLFYKDPGDIKRIDLGVVNGELYEYKRAENSLTNVIASKPFIERNRIWIEVNIPHVDNLRYIFMGADSIYRNRLIDKIPWNMYKIGD